MKPLGLDGEHGICVDFYALFVKEPCGKCFLILLFDLRKFPEDILIIRISKKFFPLGSVFFESVSDQAFDLVGQRWVAFQKPAAEGDAVCLIVEFLRIQMVESCQFAFFEDLCVQGCDTICRM